ncbi:hypothetical protein B0J18DRAFT_229370 [Chaetomium sp. MPI-SDFR-AT-0129]|nr:hypothetical protein B0J18DRAFT_229370 [Chaetomium sp. MPI-SDFR-AT-0129]
MQQSRAPGSSGLTGGEVLNGVVLLEDWPSVGLNKRSLLGLPPTELANWVSKHFDSISEQTLSELPAEAFMKLDASQVSKLSPDALGEKLRRRPQVYHDLSDAARSCLFHVVDHNTMHLPPRISQAIYGEFFDGSYVSHPPPVTSQKSLRARNLHHAICGTIPFGQENFIKLYSTLLDDGYEDFTDGPVKAAVEAIEGYRDDIRRVAERVREWRIKYEAESGRRAELETTVRELTAKLEGLTAQIDHDGFNLSPLPSRPSSPSSSSNINDLFHSSGPAKEEGQGPDDRTSAVIKSLASQHTAELQQLMQDYETQLAQLRVAHKYDRLRDERRHLEELERFREIEGLLAKEVEVEEEKERRADMENMVEEVAQEDEENGGEKEGAEEDKENDRQEEKEAEMVTKKGVTEEMKRTTEERIAVERTRREKEREMERAVEAIIQGLGESGKRSDVEKIIDKRTSDKGMRDFREARGNSLGEREMNREREMIRRIRMGVRKKRGGKGEGSAGG